MKPGKQRMTIWIILILSLSLYILLGYFVERQEFWKLVSIYALLFSGYLFVWKSVKNEQALKLSLAFSILYRFSFLFAIPALSDDVFRFIWDGRLLAHGLDPFEHLPQTYIDGAVERPENLTLELFGQLNSPAYFTIYPAINQFIFRISAIIFPDSIKGSIVMMRCFILLFEIGSLIIIYRLLKLFKLPQKNILIYALNPLVVIELTGNLHFEAGMIFFMLLAILLLVKNKWLLSSLAFVGGVATKLWPLMFLPALIKRLGWRKSLVYSVIVLNLSIGSFFLILDSATILNLLSSIELYFQKFEFNAGLYYMLRWLGYLMYGYNLIGFLGKFLAFLAFGGILIYAWRERKNYNSSLPNAMMWMLTIFLFCSTTVHPWYITPVVAFSLFTRFRYGILWSFLIFLSYSAYQTSYVVENLIVVFSTFFILCVYLVYEIFIIQPE